MIGYETENEESVSMYIDELVKATENVVRKETTKFKFEKMTKEEERTILSRCKELLKKEIYDIKIDSAKG